MPVPLIHVPSSTIADPFSGPVINAYNERAVDVVVDQDAAANLHAWVNPGEATGDELLVRFIRRHPVIVDGVDTSNKAKLTLHVVSPGTRVFDGNYQGFGRTTGFTFNPFSTEPALFGPQVALFKWTGAFWLLIQSYATPAT